MGAVRPLIESWGLWDLRPEARSVLVRPPSPLEGDSEDFKTNRTLFSRSQKLMVEHIRDGLV